MANIVARYNIKIECGNECSYCCLLKVDVRAHEVFSIMDFIKNNFNDNDINSLKERLRSSANEIAPLTAQEHLVSNIPCGLLVNDSCSIYSVRPSMCRKFHSTSKKLCIESYERPTDNSIPPSEDENLNISARAAIIGYHEGLKKSKLDLAVYEINRALLYALENPSHKQEWRTGKKAFPTDAEAKESSF